MKSPASPRNLIGNILAEVPGPSCPGLAVWKGCWSVPRLSLGAMGRCGSGELRSSFLAPDGTISSSSILLAQSLQHCVRSQNCSATDLFYQGSSHIVREWLSVAITRTLHQGEESLLELTKQLCSFLQVPV